MGQHALLSPSAAHRWMNCTAAPRLEADAPDVETEFAQEGTLAHAYCAKKLKSFLGLDTTAEDNEIQALAKYHTGEMDEYTDTYKTIVIEKFNEARKHTSDAKLLVEVKLDFSTFIPDAYGTADAVIIADNVIEIIDFKYGKGVKVSAVENEQMKIYALGAYLKYNFEYIIDEVKMTIVQPRIDNLSEFEIDVENLLDWAGNELTPKAREAYKGGKQNPGNWCQFCKVKAQCRALAEKCITVAKAHETPGLLNPKIIASEVLPWLPMVKSWATSMEEFALKQALDGVTFPGYKLVEGRSVRKITDEGAVISILAKQGYDESEYMKPSTLCGIGDLEKLVGKKAFSSLCSEYIIKPAGKPTLVTADDKRPAYNSADNDFNDISTNN